MLIRCHKESQHPAEWALGLRLNIKRTRHNVMVIRSWGQNMKFMFGLQYPLTCKPWTTLSNPCNKGRGKYNCKEVFLCCFFLRFPSCVCLWYCIVMMLNDDVDDYITFWIPIPSLFSPGPCGLFQVYQLQLVSPSFSCSTDILFAG